MWKSKHDGGRDHNGYNGHDRDRWHDGGREHNGYDGHEGHRWHDGGHDWHYGQDAGYGYGHYQPEHCEPAPQPEHCEPAPQPEHCYDGGSYHCDPQPCYDDYSCHDGGTVVVIHF